MSGWTSVLASATSLLRPAWKKVRRKLKPNKAKSGKSGANKAKSRTSGPSKAKSSTSVPNKAKSGKSGANKAKSSKSGGNKAKSGKSGPASSLGRGWKAYENLVSAFEGRQAHSPQANPSLRPPTLERQRAVAAQVRRLQPSLQFLRSLAQGAEMGHALVALARETSTGNIETSRPLLEALAARGPCRDEATIARAVMATRTDLRLFADALFALAPLDLTLRCASREFFAVRYWADESAARVAAGVLLAAADGDFTVDDYLALFESAFAACDYTTADASLRRAEALGASSSEATPQLQWYRRWIDLAMAPQEPTVTNAGHVAFAVLSYQQPDFTKTSSNLGDYTQTVAALGHLVRHHNVRLHGTPELTETLEFLRDRVRVDRRLDTQVNDVDLYLIHRDASSLAVVPKGTWFLAFGWHMSAMFGRRYDFPYHPHLRPIFVSFHVNRRMFLTAEAIAYLKAHGPIGCRDWATTYLLLSAGVDAFFSGCLTTTVDTVFPPSAELHNSSEPPCREVLYIDVPRPPAGATTFLQEQPEVKTRSFGENMRNAVETLDWYRTFEGLTTSRLHSYVPARSLDLKVDFHAKRPSDIRFDGLIGISDSELANMRKGLLDTLAGTMELILRGESEEAVYAHWRGVTADAVALAKERFRRPAALPTATRFDLEEVCGRIRAGRVDVPRTASDVSGEEVCIEISMDGNLRHQLAVVLDALEATSRRPLHLFLLSRGYQADDHQRMARLFPRISFTWLPCDEADYGEHVHLLRHITVSTIDRVLLPALVPEVDRMIHLDLDALPLQDIGVLYDSDLGGAPLAARSVLWERTASGVGVFFEHAARLPPAKASEFLRTSLSRHGFDFAPFSAGVMVLDLARMRRDRFCETFLPYLEEYGLHDQQLLNLYTGPERAILDPSWNAFPRQELAKDAAILHWAGPAKPWHSEYVRFRELWQQAEERLAVRMARSDPAAQRG